MFLSSDLDLLLTRKYLHLAKWIQPFLKAVCISWVAQEGTLFPFSRTVTAQEEVGCSNFVLQEQSSRGWVLGAVIAGAKGGRSRLCSSWEVLASPTETQRLKKFPSGEMLGCILSAKKTTAVHHGCAQQWNLTSKVHPHLLSFKKGAKVYLMQRSAICTLEIQLPGSYSLILFY